MDDEQSQRKGGKYVVTVLGPSVTLIMSSSREHPVTGSFFIAHMSNLARKLGHTLGDHTLFSLLALALRLESWTTEVFKCLLKFSDCDFLPISPLGPITAKQVTQHLILKLQLMHNIRLFQAHNPVIKHLHNL